MVTKCSSLPIPKRRVLLFGFGGLPSTNGAPMPSSEKRRIGTGPGRSFALTLPFVGGLSVGPHGALNAQGVKEPSTNPNVATDGIEKLPPLTVRGKSVDSDLPDLPGTILESNHRRLELPARAELGGGGNPGGDKKDERDPKVNSGAECSNPKNLSSPNSGILPMGEKWHPESDFISCGLFGLPSACLALRVQSHPARRALAFGQVNGRFRRGVSLI